eukprot:TRINITY_DN17406_c0_g1_i2.p1 TRINITY_DN17406_c0_g1~~TRINITY_DN17406_c0_g1_i2.p1  ORF type:complete len:274 (-),score=48.26 TRINITY_DN17406_c0_g1_i2:349-1170(-)
MAPPSATSSLCLSLSFSGAASPFRSLLPPAFEHKHCRRKLISAVLASASSSASSRYPRNQARIFHYSPCFSADNDLQQHQQKIKNEPRILVCPPFTAFAGDAGGALVDETDMEEAVGVTESGNFSASNDQLARRGLEVHRDGRTVNLDQLNALFAKVGFPRREKAKLLVALEHTMEIVWVKETASNQVVAFARATGDAVFNAIIWDVVVDPRYQGSGLGKAVMERIMAALLRRGVRNIALYAEPNVVNFYKPLGFAVDPDGVRGMALNSRKIR